MRAALEADGYDVIESADAFADVKHAKADVVVLDLFIHGETSGWQELDILTLDPATRQVPVVICSAGIATLERARSRLVDLDVHVLEKPFDIEALYAAVRVALASAPRRPRAVPA